MPFDSHAFTANAVAYHEEDFAMRKSTCREPVRVNVRACEPHGAVAAISPVGTGATNRVAKRLEPLARRRG